MSPTDTGSKPDEQDARDCYVLTRDEREFDRLNMQHAYLTKSVCDGRLIYDECIQLPNDGDVLDSGTGTGAWLLDLASRVSSNVQLYGSDIAPDNFPKSVPPNVHFTVTSSTSLPHLWTNKFKLVNQRYLFGALRAIEWPVVLGELYRVLQPGGAIQLIEQDMMATCQQSQGPAMTRCSELSISTWENGGLMPDIASRLPSLLAEVGFVDIESAQKPTPLGERRWGSIGKMGKMVYKQAFQSLGVMLLRKGLVDSGTEYEELLKVMESEWEDLGTHYTCQVVTARKPNA